jgi:hypothetical protein
MNFVTGLVIIVVVTVLAVEFGVWIMKGMLGSDASHHASRTPFARAAGYVLGVIALVAFLALATGGRPWTIVALVVAIPLAILIAYRKPQASAP